MSKDPALSKGPLIFSSKVSHGSSKPPPVTGTTSAAATNQLCDKDGTPIIVPLDSLTQLFSWEPCDTDICVPSISLRRRTDHNGGSRMDDPSAVKTIVCHDMMGGYLKDKYAQGHSDKGDYYFYQWQYIDAFIYFSHHFITIPPPCWTNLAHKNGVLSMGTIITEWKPGAKLCHELLSEEWKVTQFCDQLIAIAVHYKLDGWLVNIENPIHPALMDRLKMLLLLLTTGMQSACPGSKVIWYDSVTIEGELKWQDAVNHLNKDFFELCDGIFLNYNWSEGGLSSSRALAGDRKGEVYVGVDVFGRGCYGGGGFNTCKAMEVIGRHSLSTALFAPGWVYETQDKANFFQYQEKFWSLLSPWVDSGRVSSLPLVSAFGRGYGENVDIDGKMVHSGWWTNHSAQDIQPSVISLSALVTSDPLSSVRIERAWLDTQSVYSNGVSLKLEGAVRHRSGTSKPALARLFRTHIEVDSPLLVGLTFSYVPPSSSSLKLYLQLHTSTTSRVFLDLLIKPAVDENKDGIVCVPLPSSSRVPHLPGCVLAPLSDPHTQYLHRLFTGEPHPPQSWTTKYFVIDPSDIPGLKIQEISLGVYFASGTSPAPQPFSLALGEIKVMPTNILTTNYEVVNIWGHSYQFSEDGNTVSFTLSWLSSYDDSDPIEHYDIYTSAVVGDSDQSSWMSGNVYRGRAYSTSYHMTDVFLLRVNSKASLCVVVQPVTVSQRKRSLTDSPRLSVEFTF